MFYDYRSHSLTQLTGKFLELLSKNVPEDPFRKNWIVVQNREMQQWLSLSQSLRDRITANNEFIFPSELVWKLYRLKDSELSKNLPSDLIPMQWSIYDILWDKEELRKGFIDDDLLNSKLLLQQSKAIADVFDLYQVFRPELLKKWEQNKLVFNDPSEKWQASIWNELKKKWHKDHSISRADAFDRLKKWLTDQNFPVQEIPNNIWFFSIPQVSAPFSGVIAALSNQVDCHYFNYLIEGKDLSTDAGLFSKKLLTSAKNSNSVLLASLESNDVDVKKALIEEDSKKPESQLHQIQKLLWEGKSASYDFDDNSIAIHSCHSIKREVEVLKDHLLMAFDSEPDLKPEDILILVPNLKDYRIQLLDIFSGTKMDESIPVNVGFEDLTDFKESTFINLISILNSDFKVNQVIALLDNPIISEKWNISNDEIQIIREWANDLHIHRFLVDDVFSWVEGLNRLFLGFALEPDKFKTISGRTVYDKIYSSDSIELVGKLSSFIDQLKLFSKFVSSEFSLNEWIGKVSTLVKIFLLKSFDEDYNIRDLLQKLDSLKRQVQVSEFSKPVEFETFFLWLKDHFSNLSSASTGYGHGVVVREYVPNRAIPFKFVAVLGFNESVFPKKTTRPDFDLVNKYPKPGDRVSMDEDRFLFFDMIQSAGEKLYFSFIGQDQYSENKKAPSILLQQLIDVARSEEVLLTIEEDKLHGFDEIYFTEESKKSYSRDRYLIAKKINSQEKNEFSFLDKAISTEQENDSLEISLHDLISYSNHPARYICNNLFGIKDYNNFTELDDREPFILSGLDEYKLKDFLSEAFFKNQNNNLMGLAQAKGLLPVGHAGELSFDKQHELISQFEQVKARFDFGTICRLNIEHEIANVEVYGGVSNILNKDRVLLRLGDIKGKNLIDLWINHQVLNVEDQFSSFLFYIKNKSLVSEIRLRPDHKNQEHLEFLINELRSVTEFDKYGICPVESSFEFSKSILNGDDVNKAIDSASKKWDGGAFVFSSECDDFYNRLIFKDDSFLSSRTFQTKALKIWSPILKAIGDI